MKTHLNSKGSIWRKWDLHLHAPGTKLNNQFKDQWEEYFLKLEELEGFAVLGITDYYCVKDYFKVKEFKEQNKLKNIDLILPNIELRLDMPTKKERAINYHIIFSPDVDKYIKPKFLNELQFIYGGRVFNANRDDFIELGRTFKAECKSDEEAYAIGLMQFKVNINDIEEIFRKNKDIFEGKYITAVANKSTDGASGIKNNQFEATKKHIYQKAMMILSGNPKDYQFFLQENEELGGRKACIHGSDAHSLDKICNPDLNRFTWIKADPTFEGLLQVLYEPEKRVMIQEQHPEIKADYDVIEKVVFKSDDRFQDREIQLNPDLNTIIGGKSSGKSLLLYKIAQTISKDELTIREKDDTWTNPYKNSFIENIAFDVHWRSGKITSSENDTDSSSGKITYIPQMYINSLSEDKYNNVLQDKIKEIILRDPTIFSEMEDLSEKKKEYYSYLNEHSFDLIEKVNHLEELEIERRGLQDVSSYVQEKIKNEQLLEKLIADSKIPEYEERLLKELKKEVEQQSEALDEITLEHDEAIAYSEFLEEIKSDLQFKFSSIPSVTSKQLEVMYIETEEEIIRRLNDDIANVNQLIKKCKEDIEVYNKKSSSKRKEIQEIENRYSQGEDIRRYKVRINEQEKLIDEVQDLDSQINELKENIQVLKDKMLENLKNVFHSQKNVNEKINNKSASNVNVRSEVKFDHQKFNDKFIDNLNLRRNIHNIISMDLIDTERRFNYDQNTYIDNIEEVLDIILKIDENYLKSGIDKVKLVNDLLSLFTEVALDVEKDNDLISEMSPGKRGLVLLELFLTYSDDKHPILIDQPEDNLDNRTISSELVQFIRDKSKERQIILVTHNANLVVLTDADNVIIANQDPQMIENQKYRFEYLNGALECSFIEEGEKLGCKGIRDNACEILEGGQEAFELREKKYGFV